MATSALTLPVRRPVDFASRICQVTGLTIDLAAERLIMVNAVTAILFMVVGGATAVLIALTRSELVHLVPAGIYYRLLTLHGLNMLLYWIIFFEIAGLYFAGTVILNARLVAPKLAWAAWALMTVGAVTTNVMVVAGQADVLFSSYIPLKANPIYYLGICLFAVGALLACGIYFASLIMAKAEGRYKGSVPLVSFGMTTAAIIAVATLIGGVITFVPAFFWSLGLMNLDAEVYRLNFWSLGHPAQQINLAAMVTIWYFVASVSVDAKPLNEKLSRIAFLLYLLFINLGSVHHILVDPGLTRVFKIFNTSYAMYMAVLGSMIHAFSIPAAMEIALRAKGYRQGLFGWLRHAPWGNPAFVSVILSMVMFGFIGGTTGVIFGHEQINIVQHNTLSVPAHFHATVVAGTTLAFMGLTWYVIPLIGRRKVKFWKMAQWQPWVYGVGVLLHLGGMMVAGLYGVPRRTADISIENAASLFPQVAHVALGVMGIGGVIAAVGGVMFIVVAVASLLFGERIPASSETPKTVLASMRPPTGGAMVAAVDHSAPGSLVLVFVFLGFFILVWVLDMVKLSAVWPVS